MNRVSLAVLATFVLILLAAGALGVIYPSVRDAGGTCIACFRPAIVGNVRRTTTYEFTWDGDPNPTITPV